MKEKDDEEEGEVIVVDLAVHEGHAVHLTIPMMMMTAVMADMVIGVGIQVEVKITMIDTGTTAMFHRELHHPVL